MKKHISATTWIIIIVTIPFIIIGFPFIWANITPAPTFTYTTPSGKYVTVWRDKYIIFDKYDSYKAPKENYVQIARGYYTIYVCLKNDNSIFIWSSIDNLKYSFDENYHIKTYIGYGESRELFQKEANYDDSLVFAKYYFDNYDRPSPILTELVGDSVYQRQYFVSFNFNINPTCRYKDHVFSRYDQQYDR